MGTGRADADVVEVTFTRAGCEPVHARIDPEKCDHGFAAVERFQERFVTLDPVQVKAAAARLAQCIAEQAKAARIVRGASA